MKIEVRDLQEEKKIVEKKQVGLMKDLKRQLLAEKQRNDKLQEKMKECFTEVTNPLTGNSYANIFNCILNSKL